MNSAWKEDNMLLKEGLLGKKEPKTEKELTADMINTLTEFLKKLYTHWNKDEVMSVDEMYDLVRDCLPKAFNNVYKYYDFIR